jgi:hypothetical protein
MKQLNFSPLNPAKNPHQPLHHPAHEHERHMNAVTNKQTSGLQKIFPLLILFFAVFVPASWASYGASSTGTGGSGGSSGSNGSSVSTFGDQTNSDTRQAYFWRHPAAAVWGPSQYGGRDLLGPINGSANGGGPQKSLPPPGPITYGSGGQGVTGKIQAWPTVVASLTAFPASNNGKTGTFATAKETAIFANQLPTTGLPLSDAQFQVISRLNDNIDREARNDPENLMWTMGAMGQMAAVQAGNSAGQAAANQTQNAVEFSRRYLVNFTSDPTNEWNALRNQLFIPIAILLLLPGAVLAQVKAIIAQGYYTIFGEVNPFEGIFRSMIAIFLIPGTYLVINYGIDVSNSISITIAQGYQNIFGTDMYEDAKSLTVRANAANTILQDDNAIIASETTPQTQGSNWWGVQEQQSHITRLLNPLTNTDQTLVPDERMTSARATNRMIVNLAAATMGTTWLILCSFQVVFLYYLWCMGPIVAALWVWPINAFRSALGSWVEGVLTLCFWSLFWNTTILLMACFNGVGTDGSNIATALGALANLAVISAFNFTQLVSSAAGFLQQAVSSFGSGGATTGQGAGAGGTGRAAPNVAGGGAGGARPGANPLRGFPGGARPGAGAFPGTGGPLSPLGAGAGGVPGIPGGLSGVGGVHSPGAGITGQPGGPVSPPGSQPTVVPTSAPMPASVVAQGGGGPGATSHDPGTPGAGGPPTSASPGDSGHPSVASPGTPSESAPPPLLGSGGGVQVAGLEETPAVAAALGAGLLGGAFAPGTAQGSAPSLGQAPDHGQVNSMAQYLSEQPSASVGQLGEHLALSAPTSDSSGNLAEALNAHPGLTAGAADYLATHPNVSEAALGQALLANPNATVASLDAQFGQNSPQGWHNFTIDDTGANSFSAAVPSPGAMSFASASPPSGVFDAASAVPLHGTAPPEVWAKPIDGLNGLQPVDQAGNALSPGMFNAQGYPTQVPNEPFFARDPVSGQNVGIYDPTTTTPGWTGVNTNGAVALNENGQWAATTANGYPVELGYNRASNYQGFEVMSSNGTSTGIAYDPESRQLAMAGTQIPVSYDPSGRTYSAMVDGQTYSRDASAPNSQWTTALPSGQTVATEWSATTHQMYAAGSVDSANPSAPILAAPSTHTPLANNEGYYYAANSQSHAAQYTEPNNFPLASSNYAGSAPVIPDQSGYWTAPNTGGQVTYSSADTQYASNTNVPASPAPVDNSYTVSNYNGQQIYSNPDVQWQQPPVSYQNGTGVAADAAPTAPTYTPSTAAEAYNYPALADAAAASVPNAPSPAPDGYTYSAPAAAAAQEYAAPFASDYISQPAAAPDPNSYAQFMPPPPMPAAPDAGSGYSSSQSSSIDYVSMPAPIFTPVGQSAVEAEARAIAQSAADAQVMAQAANAREAEESAHYQQQMQQIAAVSALRFTAPPTSDPPRQQNRLDAIVSGTRPAAAPPPMAPPQENADQAHTTASLNEQVAGLSRGAGIEPPKSKMKAWHEKHGLWDPAQDGDEDA